MTNDAARANAEALPMTRRTAFAATGATLAIALASMARPAHTASADQSLVELEELIAAQREAYQFSCAKWDAAAEIEESPAMQKIPECRVQVGRLLRGRDDEGNDVCDPIYAYSDEDIEERYKPGLSAMLSMWGHGPNGEERKQKIRDQFAEKVRVKKAELAVQYAEAERIKDECGYTQAETEADAASDAVAMIEATIVAFVPGSLAAAARKAAWIVAAYEGDGTVRSYLCRDQVLDALASIGKAVAS